MTDDIRAQTGADVVTVIGAMLAALEATRPGRVAIFTPYTDELTSSVTHCVAEAGYEIACAKGMGFRDNAVIGRVAPAEIMAFVETGMVGVSADCVFLSCTNWRAIEAIDVLRGALGMPVLSSNQVTLEASRRSSL
jgi:maleate isomerase